MADFIPTANQKELIQGLVEHYVQNRGPVKRLLDSIHSIVPESESLKHLIHSVKFRMKDPEHLRDKLYRKLEKALSEGKEFGIDKDNLFMEINDLGGYRILHLHTSQSNKSTLHFSSSPRRGAIHCHRRAQGERVGFRE